MLVTASLTRVLSPADFGQYALFTLIPPMALSFMGLGLASSAVYFVAKDVSNEASTSTRLIAANLWLGVALMPAIALGFVASELGGEGDELFPPPLIYMIFIIPVFFVNAACSSILQGVQNFRASSVAAIVPNASLLVLIAAVELVTDIDLAYAAALYGLSHLASFAVSRFLVPRNVRFFACPRRLSEWFDVERRSYVMSVYIGNLLAFVNARAVVFVIGFYCSNENVALFVSLVALYEVLLFGATSVATVLLPIAARYSSLGSPAFQLTCTITKITCLLTAFAGGLLCLSGTHIMSILYGEFYADGASLLWVFAVAACSSSYLRILAAELAGRGRANLNAIIASIGAVVSVVGVSILSSRHGVYGGAIGFAISATLQAVLTGCAFCRITDTPVASLLSFNALEKRMMVIWARRLLRTS